MKTIYEIIEELTLEKIPRFLSELYNLHTDYKCRGKDPLSKENIKEIRLEAIRRVKQG